MRWPSGFYSGIWMRECICAYTIFDSFEIVYRLVFLLPTLAPKMAVTNDRHSPMNMMIPNGVVQNELSNVATSGINILQRSGAYQTLLGSFQARKKQATAINAAQIIYLGLSLRNTTWLLIIPIRMKIIIAADMDNAQLGADMKLDFFFGFIAISWLLRFSK